MASDPTARRFAFAGDPVCIGAGALYALGRWVLRPSPLAHLPWIGPFLQNWFNDVLCIPLFLPPLLWLHRRLGLRGNGSGIAAEAS